MTKIPPPSPRTLEGLQALRVALVHPTPHALARAMTEVDRRALKEWGQDLSQEGHHRGPCGILPTALVAWLVDAGKTGSPGYVPPWDPDWAWLPQAFSGIIGAVAADANAAPEDPPCPCCDPGPLGPSVPLWALVEGDPDEALITDHLKR